MLDNIFAKLNSYCNACFQFDMQDVMSEKEMLSEECKAQAIEITQINKDKADLQVK